MTFLLFLLNIFNSIHTKTVPDVLLDEDDEEDIDVLYERLPEDTTELEKCITSAQGCMLMLILKQQLKEIYGITDRYFVYFRQILIAWF